MATVEDEADAMQLDSFPVQMDGGEAVLAEADEIQRSAAEMDAQRHLFAKCHVFLSREVPRYSLEFVIAACGGQVSWAGIGGVGGGPFAENDPRITHHVVDRPNHKVWLGGLVVCCFARLFFLPFSSPLFIFLICPC